MVVSLVLDVEVIEAFVTCTPLWYNVAADVGIDVDVDVDVEAIVTLVVMQNDGFVFTPAMIVQNIRQKYN